MATKTLVVTNLRKLSHSAQTLMGNGVGYRCESAYGSGVRGARDVITHAVSELENYHLLDDVKVTFGLPRRPSLSEAVSLAEREFGEDAIAIWLATRENVRQYCNSDEEPDRYRIPDSAVLVSDLHDNGQLFIMPNKDWQQMLFDVGCARRLKTSFSNY